MMAGYLVEIFQLNTNRATNSTEDFDRQLAQCNSNKTVWVWDDSVASLSAKSQVIFSPRHYGNRPSRSTPNENCDHRWSFLGSVFDAQTEKQKNKIFSDLLRCAMADKIALILFYENILCCCCRCFHHSLRYCNEQEADSLYVIFFFSSLRLTSGQRNSTDVRLYNTQCTFVCVNEAQLLSIEQVRKKSDGRRSIWHNQSSIAIHSVYLTRRRSRKFMSI